MKLKHRVLIAVFTLGAASAALAAHLTASQGATSARGAHPSVESPKPAKVRTWPSDAVASHPFQYDSELKIQQNELHSQLSGRLVWSKSWALKNRVARCFRVLDPHASVGSGKEANRSVAGLTEPFVLIQGPDGAAEIALPSDAPQAAKQLFVGIAGALAFPAATKSGARDAVQMDASGKYRARYHLGPNNSLVKEKLKYEETDLEIKSSRTTFRFEKDSLASVDHAEHLTHSAMGMEFSTRLRVQSPLGTGLLPRACQGRVPQGFQVRPLDRASELDPSDAAKYLPRQSFVAAFAALKLTDRASFDPKTFVEVRAGLRFDESELPAVIGVIEGLDEYSPAAAALLASVETRASLKEASRLLRSENPELVKVLMEALNTHGKVNKDLLEAVRAHMNGSDAELARGAVQLFPSLLQRLEGDEEIDYPGEVGHYVAGARDCPAATICSAYALGLVSIPDDRARDQLARLADHPDSKVRWSVAVAIELLDEPKLDSALVGLIEEEADEGVKKRAIRACGFRGSATCLSTLTAVLGSGNDLEKAAAMDAIAHGRFPEERARATLQNASGRETTERIKDRILKLLQETPEKSDNQK